MEDLKFTKEIKKAWLDALNSGKYIQGRGKLMQVYDKLKHHCCLGVLCETHPDLSLNVKDDYAISEVYRGITSADYGFLMRLLSINDDDFYILYNTNDEPYEKKDYSNVIGLIEQIPTVD